MPASGGMVQSGVRVWDSARRSLTCVTSTHIVQRNGNRDGDAS